MPIINDLSVDVLRAKAPNSPAVLTTPNNLHKKHPSFTGDVNSYDINVTFLAVVKIRLRVLESFDFHGAKGLWLTIGIGDARTMGTWDFVQTWFIPKARIQTQKEWTFEAFRHYNHNTGTYNVVLLRAPDQIDRSDMDTAGPGRRQMDWQVDYQPNKGSTCVFVRRGNLVAKDVEIEYDSDYVTDPPKDRRIVQRNQCRIIRWEWCNKVSFPYGDFVSWEFRNVQANQSMPGTIKALGIPAPVWSFERLLSGFMRIRTQQRSRDAFGTIPGTRGLRSIQNANVNSTPQQPNSARRQPREVIDLTGDDEEQGNGAQENEAPRRPRRPNFAGRRNQNPQPQTMRKRAHSDTEAVGDKRPKHVTREPATEPTRRNPPQQVETILVEDDDDEDDDEEALQDELQELRLKRKLRELQKRKQTKK